MFVASSPELLLRETHKSCINLMILPYLAISCHILPPHFPLGCWIFFLPVPHKRAVSNGVPSNCEARSTAKPGSEIRGVPASDTNATDLRANLDNPRLRHGRFCLKLLRHPSVPGKSVENEVSICKLFQCQAHIRITGMTLLQMNRRISSQLGPRKQDGLVYFTFSQHSFAKSSRNVTTYATKKNQTGNKMW